MLIECIRTTYKARLHWHLSHLKIVVWIHWMATWINKSSRISCSGNVRSDQFVDYCPDCWNKIIVIQQHHHLVMQNPSTGKWCNIACPESLKGQSNDWWTIIRRRPVHPLVTSPLPHCSNQGRLPGLPDVISKLPSNVEPNKLPSTPVRWGDLDLLFETFLSVINSFCQIDSHMWSAGIFSSITFPQRHVRWCHTFNQVSSNAWGWILL